MNQNDLNRELLAMDASVALAKLEVVKAEERVQQIEYDKARFLLDIQTEFIKQQAEAVKTTPENKSDAKIQEE